MEREEEVRLGELLNQQERVCVRQQALPLGCENIVRELLERQKEAGHSTVETVGESGFVWPPE